MNFYDYIFLRRVNNAVSKCGENYLIVPVLILIFSQTYIVLWQSLLQELRELILQMKRWCSTQLKFYSMVTIEDKEDIWQLLNFYLWLKFIIISMIMKFHLMKDLFTKMIGLKPLKNKCYHSFIPHYMLDKCLLIMKEKIYSLYAYQFSHSECSTEELTQLLKNLD